MKIDSLWLKMFGALAGLNLVYWIVTTIIFDFGDVVSGSWLFTIFVAPAILPIAPFAESLDGAVFVPIVGAMCLIFLPLFWSLVLYGIARVVRKYRSLPK
jgi:hypothetical protein